MAKRAMSAAAKAKWLAGKEADIEQVQNTIIEQFKTGNIPAKLAPIFIYRNDDIPCRKWSWSNQFLVALAGYDDARTYKQWQTVGRQVKKGEKGFLILQPNRFNVKDTDKDGNVKTDENGNDKTRTIIKGFNAGKRFGLEQTEVTDAAKWAKHSKKDENAQKFLDELPLREVADKWGIKVTSYSGKNGAAQGWYRKGQTIAVGVENLSTFAHELIHASDDRLGNLKERGQHWRSEVVAELGGAVLLTACGYETDADLGGAWEYIKHYADASGKDAIKCCLEVLKRTGDAVKAILDAAEVAEQAVNVEESEKIAENCEIVA